MDIEYRMKMGLLIMIRKLKYNSNEKDNIKN